MTARIDHVASALARLPQQFRDKPKIVALVTALANSKQSLEDALIDLLLLRYIDTATGTQLDVIGRVVGQPRLLLGDDDYRRYIRARVATNRSTGVGARIIRIARLILNDATLRVVLDNQGIAAYVVRIMDGDVEADLADILISFLRDGTVGGVRIILETSTVDPNATFYFQGGPGPGFGKAGRVDLSGFTTNVDTVVRKRQTGGTAGYDTLTLVHSAGAPNAGVLTQANNPPYGVDYTFTFKGGTTTVAQFEAAINASADLHVYTVDGVGTMTAVVDEIAGAGFGIGGSNGPVTGGLFVGARE